MFGHLYGKGRYKESIDCLAELERAREERPELSTADFSPESFGEMNFHYIAQIKAGARKVIRHGGRQSEET